MTLKAHTMRKHEYIHPHSYDKILSVKKRMSNSLRENGMVHPRAVQR